MPYRWIYCLLIPFGAVAQVDLVWAWGDLMNALQIFPNLIGVIALSGIAAKAASTADRGRRGLGLRSALMRSRSATADYLSPLDRHAAGPATILPQFPRHTNAFPWPPHPSRRHRRQGPLAPGGAEPADRVPRALGADADPIVTATQRLPAVAATFAPLIPTARTRGWSRAGGARHRAALHAPGGGVRPRAGGPQRRHHHADRVGQDALLQRAGPRRDSQGSVDARALSVSDQGAGAGSARRAARALRAGDAATPDRAEIGVFTYDGDTPSDARRAIRGKAHVVLSNPDMLHSGILPHHPRWAKLFENLRFVIIDELHAYRGVFGSHLSNILRRLQRDLPALRIRSDLHLLVGDDRQSARACGRADRPAVRAGRAERRAARREVLPVRQPAGRQRRSSASAARISPKRAASRSSS